MPLSAAGRTFLQTFIGVYLAGVLASTDPNTFGALTDLGLLESAAAASIVAVLSFVQNLLEDSAEVGLRQGLTGPFHLPAQPPSDPTSLGGCRV